MISDVDIRDWEKSIVAAKMASERLGKDHPNGSYDLSFLKEFIDKVEAAIYLNRKQIPALFKPMYLEVPTSD
jgi:hypothetical protein